MDLEDANSPKARADALRKKYLYRRLLTQGKLKLPRKSAIRLIGPDCAYHLYGLRRKKSG